MSRPTSRLIRAARRHADRHRFDHLTEGRDSPSTADDTPAMTALEVALMRAEADAHRAGTGA